MMNYEARGSPYNKVVVATASSHDPLRHAVRLWPGGTRGDQALPSSLLQT